MARLNVCDGIQDCRDGSDESQCFRNKKRRRKNKHQRHDVKNIKHHGHHKAAHKDHGISNSKMDRNLPSYSYKNEIQPFHGHGIGTTIYSNLSTDALYNIWNLSTNPTMPTTTKNSLRYDDENSRISSGKYDNFDANTIDSYWYSQDENEKQRKNKQVETKTEKAHETLPTVEVFPALKYSPTIELSNKVTRSLKLLNLKVYPPNQKVYEGGDVVIQCRDEGDLRVDVYWEKAVNKRIAKDYSASKSFTLPPGAVDYNGRLEISRILYNQGGTYLCRAVAYENEIGGEAIATVKVSHLP